MRAIGVAILVLGLLSLNLMCKLSENCEDVVKMCRNTAIENLNKSFGSGRKNARIIVWQAKAMEPLRIIYEPFFYIDRGFVTDLFGNVCDKIFEAILLFQ
ncbi:unnamed protein product [Orchesella dallaii]|uniref:Uncharacterized protein n=1 Tax=Orchesella dallaii TaxID=48710 RepID=A0ABP1QV91_9HEXA